MSQYELLCGRLAGERFECLAGPHSLVFIQQGFLNPFTQHVQDMRCTSPARDVENGAKLEVEEQPLLLQDVLCKGTYVRQLANQHLREPIFSVSVANHRRTTLRTPIRHLARFPCTPKRQPHSAGDVDRYVSARWIA